MQFDDEDVVGITPPLPPQSIKALASRTRAITSQQLFLEQGRCVGHREDKTRLKMSIRKSIAHSVFPTHNGVLSHAAAFLVTVGFVVYSSSEKHGESRSRLFDTLVRFVHLFSFSTWVGVQFWVHVSGFTMYKTLTRNSFVKVQSKMFPMYFTAGVVTSALSLATHLYINPVVSWEKAPLSFYQTLGLMISLVCSLLNMSYLGPETVRLVEIRAERIKLLGIKDAVGPVCPNLVKHDDEYMKVRKAFLKMHMLCSFVNLMCYGACGINIWCLASKQLV